MSDYFQILYPGSKPIDAEEKRQIEDAAHRLRISIGSPFYPSADALKEIVDRWNDKNRKISKGFIVGASRRSRRQR